MLLTETRRPGRTTPDGDLVLLADQDRSRWAGALIAEGQAIVRECLRRNRPGPYQVQAAINAVHSDARSAANTDWRQVVQLYDQLLALSPTPVVALNRAVAVAEADGAAAALEGVVGGANQSEENPLGEGGERLHDWVVPLAAWRQSHGEQGGEVNESARIVEESRENIGAGVMGRNMFGPVHGGAWGDEQWTGWWGDNPPYHYPVFILTHYPRDPVEMEGGTTFHFVTDGIESPPQQATKAPGRNALIL